MSEPTSSAPLRVLFINRMASMVRGGGETFDLEIARHLADLDCEVTFLTGIPLFGKAALGPEEWWGGGQGRNISVPGGRDLAPRRGGQHPTSNPPSPSLRRTGIQQSNNDSIKTAEDNLFPATSIPSFPSVKTSSIQNPKFKIQSQTLRSPYTGWFPWDKTPGGWRLRVADFKIFEWLAARWAIKHRNMFDVIQVCELPYFVHFFKSHIAHRTSQIPVVMRLTAPDFHDPVGGLQKADAVIASGDTMRKVREELRPDCVDIPNGVDVQMFGVQGSSFRERHKIPNDAIVISHIARFQSVKNHAMLIDAFTKFSGNVPDAWLVLAGSGPLQEQIRAKVKAAGLENHVLFLGEVRHADLPDVYAAADINVMPSDYESFCFAVLEGMASGLPHVVTDTNWVPGLLGGNIQHSTSNLRPPTAKIKEVSGGLITPVGDADAFAEALTMLAQNPYSRNKMGEWNRERVVQEFGWSVSAERLRGLYFTLASNNA